MQIHMSNLYDQHKHLNEAKIACENDSQCIGIYEDSCDKDGPFLLLKSGFLTSVSGTNCIYKKTIYSKLKAKETLKIYQDYQLFRGKRMIFRKSVVFLTSGPASKCFDVSMYKSTSDFGWSLGNCSGSDKWLGSGTYTDQCCITEELQVLTCSTRSRGRGDWSNSILMMLGHQFCDDFVGHNAFIEINVTG